MTTQEFFDLIAASGAKSIQVMALPNESAIRFMFQSEGCLRVSRFVVAGDEPLELALRYALKPSPLPGGAEDSLAQLAAHLEMRKEPHA